MTNRSLWTRLAGVAALACAIAVAASSACSSSTTNTTCVYSTPLGEQISCDFSSPAGLATAPARDRDLLFIANQGGNELRVISICRSPANSD
ncbi:MAG: hypothetical protein JST92_25895, partial [Deltaproteobacteria bacterium]|nr:hypothetical protein [Deltaproteobacteria bacterium]